jgi:hypothetical protein
MSTVAHCVNAAVGKTLGSGVTRTTQGRFGGALAFNGANTLTVPHSALLNLTSAMTLEPWPPFGPSERLVDEPGGECREVDVVDGRARLALAVAGARLHAREVAGARRGRRTC